MGTDDAGTSRQQSATAVEIERREQFVFDYFGRSGGAHQLSAFEKDQLMADIGCTKAQLGRAVTAANMKGKEVEGSSEDFRVEDETEATWSRRIDKAIRKIYRPLAPLNSVTCEVLPPTPESVGSLYNTSHLAWLNIKHKTYRRYEIQPMFQNGNGVPVYDVPSAFVDVTFSSQQGRDGNMLTSHAPPQQPIPLPERVRGALDANGMGYWLDSHPKGILRRIWAIL